MLQKLLQTLMLRILTLASPPFNRSEPTTLEPPILLFLHYGLDFLKMQNEGLSIRDIAQKENKDKNHVAARLNLTKFDQDCIDFILKHKLTNVAKLLKILETESTNHKQRKSIRKIKEIR